MSSSLITSLHQTTRARTFVESFSTEGNSYYLFISNHLPTSNTTLQDVYDDPGLTIDVYRNMIQGKKITEDDVSLVIRNVPWVSNTVYDMYDDQDIRLKTKDFFVVVDEDSYYHVYKCLDNNMGAESTAKPTFSHISGGNTDIYQTSDGYRWKYMYSVDSATHDKFASDDYIPVFANSSVANNATPGSIDIIKIEDTGKGYDNYITGTFSSEDIKVNANNQLYGISNSVVSTVNGFYTGCILYISAGDGAGESRTIIDFISNEEGNFVVLDNSLTTPTNGSKYEIYPKVEVSNIEQSTNVIARALVNALASNSIYRVEMIDRGEGYDYRYMTANVIANTVVAVSSVANLRVIYSPPLGHGYDVAEELYADSVSVSVTISNSESNTLLTTNQFRQFGIIHNPTFDNVYFETDASNGTFSTNENFYRFNKIKISDNAAINSTSTLLVSDNGDFENQLSANEMIFIQNDDEANQMIVAVESVINSSTINLASNGLFSANDCHVYKTVIGGSGVVIDSVNSIAFYASNCTPTFTGNDTIIGEVSGKLATVNTISRNDVIKNFSTFIQLYKHDGILVSGAFDENEILSQNNVQASLFSFEEDGSNTTIYVSNQTGAFTNASSIVGDANDAVFTLLTTYKPELTYGAGDILYLENINPVARKNTENEKFQLFFQF